MTHLTLEHREVIEDALKEKINFTDIADMIGYHRTSISSEVKNRRTEYGLRKWHICSEGYQF